MARVSVWPIIMFAMVLCLLLLYLQDTPLQQILGKLYYFTTRGSHYWNKLIKLPPISERFYLIFRPSSHIPRSNNNGEEGLFNEAKIAEEKLKSDVIEAAEKSLEETKKMVEDSAKTAAEMVGEAVRKTAVVVQTFSKSSLLSQAQDEL